MITKFEKYNEGIRHLLVGPTKEEVWIELMNGKLKGLIKSVPESPEDFFYQIKDGCVEMSRDEKGIYYGKNKIELFKIDLKNQFLYIDYNHIWSFLENMYDFNSSKTQTIIKNILLKDINWNKLIPRKSYYI